jgi:hypothetical protein
MVLYEFPPTTIFESKKSKMAPDLGPGFVVSGWNTRSNKALKSTQKTA